MAVVRTSARYARETDQITAAAAPAHVDPVDPAPALGEWRNTNHRTWGVTRLELTDRGGALLVHAWAADPQAAEIRDWGVAPVEHIYADAPFSSRIGGYTATFDLGHARVEFQANMVYGLTVLAAFTTFTDGSGRASYMSREFFHRRG